MRTVMIEQLSSTDSTAVVQFKNSLKVPIEYPDTILSYQDSLLLYKQYWVKEKARRAEQARVDLAKVYEEAQSDSLYNETWCFGQEAFRKEVGIYYETAYHPTGRLSAQPRPQTAMNSDGMSFILIGLFFFIAISFKSGCRSVFHRVRYLFEVKRRENIFYDSTVNETYLRSALLLCLFVLEGVVLYSVSLNAIPQLSWFNVPVMVLCATAVCGFFYFVQQAVYALLGYVFSNPEDSRLMRESFVSVNLVLCIALSPFVLALIYYPAYPRGILYIIAAIYLILRIVFIYRGVKIFLSNIYGLLYFILYLCALEVTPLLILYKGTLLLYNFVELRLI